MVHTTNIIKELTPLSDKDCLYIVERHKNEFTYPMHTHDAYELNFIRNGHGLKRILCFKMAEEGSVTIECMTLRGDGPSPVDPTGCPEGTAVTLPAKDGYKDGESWGATWNGEKQMATWTQAWGGLYLGMNNADWSGYKDLYIKFDGEVPAKLIVDVNGNGNNDPQEISGGDHIIIPIQGNKNVDFSKVECLCFKLAAKDSVKIQCMTLRGVSEEPITGCGGILVNLPEKDGYKDGESWGATWDGATHTATWTDAWGGFT